MEQSVEQYLAAVPAQRQALARGLHGLILRLFPGATVDMHYRMPTYRHGDGWVALANQKRYVSLYTCGAHHLARFRERQPGIRTGKGCINLRPGAEVPWDDLAEVVRHAIEHPKP